jgi:ribosomal protein S18 acetylase RimI-like enzyme
MIKFLEIPDLCQVSEIHRGAFPDSLLTALGTEVVRRYYEWQLIGPHETTALGVFEKDILQGFCFGGVFHGAMNGFLRKNRYFLIGKILTHPAVFLYPEFRQRILTGWKSKIFQKVNLALPNVSSAKARRHFGILSIGVDPELQRRGIGKLLMEAAEEEARKKGHQEMRLTVAINNLAAINFYEKLGWEKCLSEDGSFQGAMRQPLVADPNG